MYNVILLVKFEPFRFVCINQNFKKKGQVSKSEKFQTYILLKTMFNFNQMLLQCTESKKYKRT